MLFTYFNACLLFFCCPYMKVSYTLSLHDALPIWSISSSACSSRARRRWGSASSASSAIGTIPIAELADDADPQRLLALEDRKSTRLNSSHANISYAFFSLQKKNKYGWE